MLYSVWEITSDPLHRLNPYVRAIASGLSLDKATQRKESENMASDYFSYEVRPDGWTPPNLD